MLANLAEGFAKQFTSNAEYKRFIIMALGSANEMLVWIDYARTLEYVTPDTAIRWQEDYTIICKMLRSLHKSRNTLDL